MRENNNIQMDTYRIEFGGLKDIDLTHMFECGQCFRWIPAGDGSGDYVGAAGKYAARASLTPGEDGSKTLSLEVTGGDEAFWRNYFDLDTDYTSIKERLVEGDPAISDAADYGGGIRILKQDLFETIISFIISQNNNIPRIRKNIESICTAYGAPIGEAFGRMWYAFPEPEALAAADIDELNSMKLGYRSDYIKAAGRKFMDEPEPETREDVLGYFGIGPKVANCIMLFGLRQTDAFPVDTWVKHIMNDMYGFDESDVREMTDFARERFGELAGYAQQYLFYYYRDRR